VVDHRIDRVDQLHLVELQALIELLDAICHVFAAHEDFLIAILARAQLKKLLADLLAVSPLALLGKDFFSLLPKILINGLQKLLFAILESLDQSTDNMIYILQDAILSLIACYQGLSDVNQYGFGAFNLQFAFKRLFERAYQS
jgi:hypothetical protein